MSSHTPLRIAFRRPWPGTVRGRILWFFAAIIGIKGAGYMFGINSNATDTSMRLLTQWIPLSAWGLIVVAACAFSAFTAFCHHGRDRYGYDALTGLCGLWAGIYMASALFLQAPAGLQGALSWALIGAALIFLRRLRDIRDINLPDWR